MNFTGPEGNQGRAKVCQDFLDPSEPHAAFGAEPLNLRPWEEIALIFPGVQGRIKNPSVSKH